MRRLDEPGSEEPRDLGRSLAASLGSLDLEEDLESADPPP
jgi:hypothetical protein